MVDDPFPVFEDDEELELFNPDEDLDEDVDAQPGDPYGFTWRFDFAEGDIFLNAGGETVEARELECVKEWIQHTLSITRFESPIYGTDVGTDIGSLIGSRDDEFVMSRIRSEIEIAALAHDRIESVNVAEVFKIGNVAYAFVEFTTDDSEQEELLLTLG